MKSVLRQILFWLIVTEALVCGQELAHGQMPDEAQASNLAVPAPRATPYASAIIIAQCHQVIAVVFVNHDGTLVPQHWPNLTAKELQQKLLEAVPTDAVDLVEANCPGEVVL